MAAAPNPCIHLEAMEETEDQTKEPDEAWCAGILRTYGCQLSEGLLVYGEHRSRDKGHNTNSALKSNLKSTFVP